MGGSSSRHREVRQQTRANRDQQSTQPQPPVVRQQQSLYPYAQQRQLGYQAPTAQPQVPSPPPLLPPSQAQVKDTQTVVNCCTVLPNTFSINGSGDEITFLCNCTVPAMVEVHVAISEFLKEDDVVFTPNQLDRTAPIPKAVKDGENVEVVAKIPEMLTMRTEERKYLKQWPKQIPMAIVLSYMTPDNKQQAEITYVEIDPQLKVFRQMVKANGAVFVVEQIFGVEEGHQEGSTPTTTTPVAEGEASPTVGAIVETSGEDEELCVVCLTIAKDTVVLPCRHLCLCKTCAEELMKHTPKCPVCRGPVSQLLHMSK